MARGSLERDARRLRQLADELGARWVEAAGRRTTAGRERSVLRLFGIDGLDNEGRPLAAEVVDRYLAGSGGRLASGIALPFVVAMLEYDVTPQRLALDVATGAVDLALEGQLLARRERRTAATAEAARLVTAAVERIDANRTARRELLDVLGDAPRPWIGASIAEPAVLEAIGEARGLVRDGADVLQVDVPAGRELVRRLGERGVEVPRWSPRQREPEAPPPDDAPAGSQRGLAALRDALDEAAAGRGAYVRLMTTPPALACPEAAVVAAFERVDVVESDPASEIVTSGVDPDRAIADQVAAARVHRRAGTAVLLGAGPLAVGPDLVTGMPSDPATRAGRGLALQLCAAGLLRAAGLPAASILAGALPAWLADEPDATAQAVAEVALRRAALPDHPLAFLEPADAERAVAWPFVVSATLPGPPAGAVVLRRRRGGPFAPLAASTRAAVSVAAGLADARSGGQLAGPAARHVAGAAAAALASLERLAVDGWGWLVGDAGEHGRGGLGRDAVAERAEPDVVSRVLDGPLPEESAG